MTNTHDIERGRPRHRIALMAALLLTALTAATSLVLAMPERANAGHELCPRGHFCIWEHAGYKGGMYNSGGSDRDLSNNVFYKTDSIVANEATALYNRGRKGELDDVVVYMSMDDDVDLTHPPSFCVPRRKRIDHLVGFGTAEGYSWNDSIAGYRWATDAECRRAGPR